MKLPHQTLTDAGPPFDEKYALWKDCLSRAVEFNHLNYDCLTLLRAIRECPRERYGRGYTKCIAHWLIEANEEGLYILTPKGERVLSELEALELEVCAILDV